MVETVRVEGDYVDPDEAAREAEVDLMNATKESKMAKSEGEYAIYGFAADGEAVFVNQHPGENEAIQEAEGHARFNAMRYVVALVDIKGDDFLLDHDRIVFDTEEATAKPKRVIVEVSDGVAEVTYADEGVEITVHDHDSERMDPAGFTQWTATGPLDLEGRVDWRAAGRER